MAEINIPLLVILGTAVDLPGRGSEVSLLKSKFSFSS
jgi:hypothetical protein